MIEKEFRTKMKDCFGKNLLMKAECFECVDVIECLMKLYDKPLPSLVLYSSDLIEVGENQK